MWEVRQHLVKKHYLKRFYFYKVYFSVIVILTFLFLQCVQVFAVKAADLCSLCRMFLHTDTIFAVNTISQSVSLTFSYSFIRTVVTSVVGRGFLTPLFYKDPPMLLTPLFQILLPATVCITLNNSLISKIYYPQLLFKNYSLVEVMYLLIRCNKTKFFL